MWTPRVLTVITFYQLGVVGVATLLTLWLWPAGGIGVLTGGLFAAANFWALRVLVERSLRTAGKSRILWGLLLAFKLVLALGLMAALVLLVRVHPLAFALGLGTLAFGMGLGITHVILTARAPSA